MQVQETGLRQTLISYVENARQTGLDLRQAAEAALERVIAEDLASEVLRLFGPTLLVNLWRTDQTMRRSDVFNGHTSSDTHQERAVEPPAVDAPVEPGRGQRCNATQDTVAPVSLTDALLDMEYPVSPRVWKPLRLLTGTECEVLYRDYRDKANVHADRARFFKSLSGALKPDQTVGTLPRERLERFMQEAAGTSNAQAA
jgi:hypothetical protein